MATKEALSWNSAISLHPQEACRQIYEAVKRPASGWRRWSATPFPSPWRSPSPSSGWDAANARPPLRPGRRPFAFADAYTREGTLDHLEDLFN